VRDHGDDEHRAEHEADGEQRDGERVLAQVAEGGEERGSVEERRKDRNEDEVRRKLELRDPRDEPEPETATSRIGYGILVRSAATSKSATTERMARRARLSSGEKVIPLRRER
jgi:hypothetical protein